MSKLLATLLVVAFISMAAQIHATAADGNRAQVKAPRNGVGPRLIVCQGETVVASAVVTGAPYNADKTGKRDATASIQKALDDVAAMKGGVVFLPAGRYRILGSLHIPYSTTLHGEWSNPDHGGSGKGTILMAYSGRGSTSGPGLIQSMPAESGLIGVSIWYPDQKAGKIVPYPPSVSGDEAGLITLRNITFYNSYSAVEFKSMSGNVVESIFGTALKQGIVTTWSGEVSWLRDVHFSNKYWRKAAVSLTGAALSESEARSLDQFTRRELVGIELGRIDGMAFYGYSADDAKTSILMRKSEKYPELVFGFGGVIAQAAGTREEIGWAPWYFWTHYANVDNVPEARGKRYTFATIPTAKRTDAGSLIVVTSPPYKASGNGLADDTAAIQAALRDAGKRGGGTVYLPQGEYKITEPLVIPRGVELRGPLGTVRAREYHETCTLAAHFGANTHNPESDSALVTLMDNSGIRGLTIAHPEQPFDASRVQPYPYAIRGRGKGIWICDVDLLNSYLGIDLATYQCDAHTVVGVWGSVYKKGIDVGGGSRGGRLERLAFSYGTLTESGRFASQVSKQSTQAIADYTFNNSIHYSFGDCEGERGWGLFGFYPAVHFHFYKGRGRGCVGAEFWQSIHDVPNKANVIADAGENVDLIGYFGTDRGTGNWLQVGPDFAGPLNVFGRMVNPNFQNQPLNCTLRQVRFYDEVSLVTGKKASADHSLPGSSPDGAIDRDPTTMWQAPSGSYLEVDLGDVRTIDRCRVEGSGMQLAKQLNLLQAELRVSLDGRSFTSACVMDSHGSVCTDVPIEPVQARYVRLYVPNPGGDDVIRVASFDVFGPRK